jgi:hypothetical protein
MSKTDRALLITNAMKLEEQEEFLLSFLRSAREVHDDIYTRRLDLISLVEEAFCDRCGDEMPEDKPGAKPHDCPNEPICECGHAASEHDPESEEGKCLGKHNDAPCDCEAFEEEQDEEDEEDES